MVKCRYKNNAGKAEKRNTAAVCPQGPAGDATVHILTAACLKKNKNLQSAFILLP